MGSLDSWSMSEPQTLGDLLNRAAFSSSHLKLYDEGAASPLLDFSYKQLLDNAKQKAPYLRQSLATQQSRVVLLHFSTFHENVEWFWAAVLARLLPAVDLPLPPDRKRRDTHLTHVIQMLDQPLVLTSKRQASDFEAIRDVKLVIVDSLELKETDDKHDYSEQAQDGKDAGVLMLTSGSSGNSKAVVLRHEQIIASVRGKSRFFGLQSSDVFLNWIGFDHVASLVETHIHAMYLQAPFIHVPASVLLQDPVKLLQLVETRGVSFTFAPQFFLAKLVRELEANRPQKALDLSCLKVMTSGGEANVVQTAVTLTNILKDHHNVNREIIKPGFGMTETCAGSIYGLSCPSYDVSQGNAFASLGKPIPGVRMRIVDSSNIQVVAGTIGDLQVTGEQVFHEYFNNKEANMASFTEDGWFRTGDRAFIDSQGNLSLAGREKEVINLNGVKHSPNEIESALDSANIPGLTPSWTVVFSTRPEGSPTEELCVVYLPTFDLSDIGKRIDTARSITLLVGMVTSTRPKHIIPLTRGLLHKSALGKLSRAKIKAAFERGDYAEFEDSKNPHIKEFRAQSQAAPQTETEIKIFNALKDVVDVAEDDVDINDSIFAFGVTSLELFTLKGKIEKAFGLEVPLPVGTLLTNPTIKGIAQDVEALQQGGGMEYDPVVPLRSDPYSSKTPLWLVHPGSGDVFVFVPLAKLFTDRTVYGIRTKGLNTDAAEDEYFRDILEMATCYVANIKKHQPQGPYAIAGYSLGSIVAFEMAKLLEIAGDKVAFLGILDQPLHVRELLAPLNWIDILLSVSYFMELITEEFAHEVAPQLYQKSHDHALDFVLQGAPSERVQQLAMSKARLRKIANVMDAFGDASKKYQPGGTVQCADIFWVSPPQSAAKSRQDWMDNHLIHWNEFVEERPRYHECDGVHSKMLNLDVVVSFYKTLIAAMAARGL